MAETAARRHSNVAADARAFGVRGGGRHRAGVAIGALDRRRRAAAGSARAPRRAPPPTRPHRSPASAGRQTRGRARRHTPREQRGLDRDGPEPHIGSSSGVDPFQPAPASIAAASVSRSGALPRQSVAAAVEQVADASALTVHSSRKSRTTNSCGRLALAGRPGHARVHGGESTARPPRLGGTASTCAA